MKNIWLSLTLLFSFNSFAKDAICYDNNNSFLISAPDGWVADFERAKEMGLCVLFYQKGKTFDNAPAIIYPRIVDTKASGIKAVDELVELSSNMYKQKKYDFTVEVMNDFKTKKGLNFIIRHFKNAPAPQEYEAIAYYLGKKNAVLISVLSTRNPKDFSDNLLVLNEFIEKIILFKKK